MEFTAKDVQRLREMTGAGMMDCKRALTDSNGDMDAAVLFLREKGLAAAAKKASRIASEGVVLANVYDGGVGMSTIMSLLLSKKSTDLASEYAKIEGKTIDLFQN